MPSEVINAKYTKSPILMNYKNKNKKQLYISSTKITTCSILLKIKIKIIISSIKFRYEF